MLTYEKTLNRKDSEMKYHRDYLNVVFYMVNLSWFQLG